MAEAIRVTRSVFFYIGFALTIVVFGLLACFTGPILPTRPHQSLVTVGNFLALHWLRLTCGIRVEIEGLENLPGSPAVILSNHESTWETFYLQRLFRPVSTILKKELLRIPFFGWGLYFMKPIAIDRSNPKDALKKVLAGGIMRLKQGNNVLIYPQGSRHSHKARASYARSGAAIAIAAGVPLIPVVHNAATCWPSETFIKQAGVIKVIIGKPLETQGKDSRALTEAVQSWIESQRSEMPS